MHVAVRMRQAQSAICLKHPVPIQVDDGPEPCIRYVQGKSLWPRPGIEPRFHGRPVRDLVTIPGSIQIRFSRMSLNGGEKCINK
jgi:hypothetical protein